MNDTNLTAYTSITADLTKPQRARFDALLAQTTANLIAPQTWAQVLGACRAHAVPTPVRVAS